MPASLYMPDVIVEIAFDSGYLTPAASRTWTDVSAYVEAKSSISISRGRPDQFSTAQPSRLTLTLDNKDGRFTPENASGAYYPNVKKGRPIRVTVTVGGTGGSGFTGVLGAIGSKPGSLALAAVGGGGGGGYTSTRFLGYIDEWPVEWPTGTESYSAVSISATSRMARLGRTAELKSIVEEEILYDGPTLYFPLGEPEGALEAGNISPARSERLVVTQYGTGGTLAFGAATGPGTDDLTAPTFTRVSTSNGLYLSTTLLEPLPANTLTIQAECYFSMPDTAGSGCDLLWVDASDTASRNGLNLEVNATGVLVATMYLNNASTGFAGTVATFDDELVHHVMVRATLNTATDQIAVSIVADGTTTTGAAAGWSLLNTAGDPIFQTFRYLRVGGRPYGGINTNLLNGSVSHAALYASTTTGVADARFVQHYNAGANGFTSDTSGARIQRLARLAGIPAAEVTVETGLSTTIAHKDTTGESPLNLMEAVAQTEDGVLFDAGDGTLTFHARSHRYGSTSAFTLDCDDGDIEAGLMPRLDDQNLTNDVTASRPNGVTVRSTNPASIIDHGYYRESVEILTTSDNEVQSRADWQAQRFGNPRVTVPDVSVDLITSAPALITSLLTSEIGTRLTLDNLPSQAPATTQDFFIEGISEEIGAESYRISFNTSATDYSDVFIWDTSVWDESTVWAY